MAIDFKFPGNPYPEYLQDEVSGVAVKNDKYAIWSEGFVEGVKAGIKTLMVALTARELEPEVAAEIMKLIGE